MIMYYYFFNLHNIITTFSVTLSIKYLYLYMYYKIIFQVNKILTVYCTIKKS